MECFILKNQYGVVVLDISTQIADISVWAGLWASLLGQAVIHSFPDHSPLYMWKVELICRLHSV